jgi:hypothetical protein
MAKRTIQQKPARRSRRVGGDEQPRARELVNDAFGEVQDALELAETSGMSARERRAFERVVNAFCTLDEAMEEDRPNFGTWVRGGEA